MRVYVTQEDIDKGKPKDMYQCPIALAVRRLVPDRASSVTDELCIPRRNLPPRYVEPYCEDLPSEASEFISHFDADADPDADEFPDEEPLKPFHFDIPTFKESVWPSPSSG